MYDIYIFITNYYYTITMDTFTVCRTIVTVCGNNKRTIK